MKSSIAQSHLLNIVLIICDDLLTGADWRLLVISKRTLLGHIPGGHEVYRIDRVAVLTLSSNESPEFELDVSKLTPVHQSKRNKAGLPLLVTHCLTLYCSSLSLSLCQIQLNCYRLLSLSSIAVQIKLTLSSINFQREECYFPLRPPF